MKGGRRQGRQRKRWKANIRELAGLGFGRSQRTVENREKWRKLVCEIICGAPTTLTVKGLMMMMMMMMMMMITIVVGQHNKGYTMIKKQGYEMTHHILPDGSLSPKALKEPSLCW